MPINTTNQKLNKYEIGTDRLVSKYVIYVIVAVLFICVFLFPFLAETFSNTDPGAIFASLIFVNALVFVSLLAYNKKKYGSDVLIITNGQLEIQYANKEKSTQILNKSEIKNITFKQENALQGLLPFYSFLITLNNTGKIDFSCFSEDGKKIINDFKQFNYPL